MNSSGDSEKTLRAIAPGIAASFEETKFNCYSYLVDCGEAAWRRIDLAEAARWYRIAADDSEAAFRLGRLLTAHPELEVTAGEGIGHLQQAADAGNVAARFLWVSLDLGSHPLDARPSELAKVLASLKSNEAAELAFEGATGRFGDPVIGPSFLYLNERAEGSDPDAAVALLSVYSFYGAYGEAAKVAANLKDGRWFDVVGWDYSIDRVLSFWQVEIGKGHLPKVDQLDGLRRLLSALSALGSMTAVKLQSELKVVDQVIADKHIAVPKPEAAATPLTEVDEREEIKRIKDRITEKKQLGGLSPLLVGLYRRLGAMQAAVGEKNEAGDSFLLALSTGEQINLAMRHLQGSLVYHLEQSCQLRRASEDLVGLGRPEGALLLAKAAVNELQDARADLVGLPQGLQGCFREILSDQYRALADLFIQQGHFLEAEWTLSQLKDYETYEFNRNDADVAKDSFKHIPSTSPQNELLSKSLGLPLLEQVRLSRRMMDLASISHPSQEQILDKEEVVEKLKQADEDLQVQLVNLRQMIIELKPPETGPSTQYCQTRLCGAWLIFLVTFRTGPHYFIQWLCPTACRF